MAGLTPEYGLIMVSYLGFLSFRDLYSWKYCNINENIPVCPNTPEWASICGLHLGVNVFSGLSNQLMGYLWFPFWNLVAGLVFGSSVPGWHDVILHSGDHSSVWPSWSSRFGPQSDCCMQIIHFFTSSVLHACFFLAIVGCLPKVCACAQYLTFVLWYGMISICMMDCWKHPGSVAV